MPPADTPIYDRLCRTFSVAPLAGITVEKLEVGVVRADQIISPDGEVETFWISAWGHRALG